MAGMREEYILINSPEYCYCSKICCTIYLC